jgi:hypothetical protein
MSEGNRHENEREKRRAAHIGIAVFLLTVLGAVAVESSGVRNIPGVTAPLINK